MGSNIKSNFHTVSFAAPGGFATTFKSDLKETFFPDDPFKQFKKEKPLGRVKKAFQYFIPIFEWLPKYSLRMFQFDLLADSCVVPSIVYAIFRDSKHVAVGTLGTSSLLIAETINKVASPEAQPALYLHLIFTVTFVTGIFQAALGLR
ncbi:unnamed protein product [Prunus armeniaca]|uniref:SLC26A/SulP transporter domain-containing protein n=1 Tax=Prunus armeniaca TaxID=36596 RepID=A0A6J5Y0C3_PRUAR|nr:unnamed protein product [Prunus armeniaca]